MTANYHSPIVTGESNSPNTINTRLSDIDAAVTGQATEISAAAGPYANLSDRLDSMVLAGGNIASFAVSAAAAAQPIVTLDSATGFVEGARVAYALAGGSVEYNSIDSIGSFGVVTFANDIGAGGIPENGIVSMISESEYQASQVLTAAGAGVSRTLTTAITWLEREVNTKAFGSIGDNSSHLVGSGAALTAAQAQYPLTHAAHVITATDEHDWCAIQEAILSASASSSSVEQVYIPVGSYKVNRTITVPMNTTDNGRTMTIIGAGHRATATSGTTITLTADTTLFLIPSQTALCNMALIGNTYTDSDSIGVRIGGKISAGDPWDSTNSVQVWLEGLRFGAGWYRCIFSLYECDQLSIIRCLSFGSVGQAVVYLSNDYFANSISPSANVVLDLCHFAFTASTTSGDNLYGVYLIGTEASVIRNSVIRGYDHTIYLDGASGSRNYNLKIEGIHSEITQELKTATSNRWTPNTAYTAGNIIRPAPARANGWWYKCTGAGTTAANSIRNITYEWTASARGTNEYYLQLASAGGNPSITEPLAVMEDGAAMTFGFAGRLAAGQWGYGQNDSQGYNTIYVRLSDSTDPDTKATHYLWTSANEPTWPTAYGGMVTDGGVTWTAYKRSVFCEASIEDESIANGLRIEGCYTDLFAAFIYLTTTINDAARIAIGNCSVRNCDMVYTTSANVRASFMAENSSLDGCIRPYATLGAGNAQTAVVIRFCSRSNDYVAALGEASKGISTWFTAEPISNYNSQLQIDDANTTIDLINNSQVMVSTGSSGSAVTVYVPRITSSAWVNGLTGKQITVVHANGSDSLTLGFNSAQLALHGGSTAGSIAMADVGDVATIQLGTRAGGTANWFLRGSYGI